jgi:hypothetical protein
MSRKTIIALTLMAAAWTLGLAASASANETVMVCDIYGDQVAPSPGGLHGIGATATCPGNDDPFSYTLSNPPGGMAIWTGAHNTIPQGTAVHWTVNAPPGMTIASIYMPHMYSQGIDDGTGWGGGFYWAGGSGGAPTFDGESGWSSASTAGPGFSWPATGSPYFGWQVVCGVNSCSNGGYQWLSVELLQLNMLETTGPYLVSPDGLWQASGWIRGTWTLHFYGDSPSGLCTLSATLDVQPLPGSRSTQDQSTWHQCSAPAVYDTVSTAKYRQGRIPLQINGLDAANEPIEYLKTLSIDNQAPTISLSGPTDAPTTAGTQYVTATASAGPSGVAGISCSLDNAPGVWHSSASIQVAVQGRGVHHLSCYSQNNARDATGAPGTSSTARWTLSIRTPSVSTASFSRVIDALRCRTTYERVHVPPHWVTAYHNHLPVRVKLPGQSRRVKVVRCHPRVVRKRVRVHGHWRVIRTLALPHAVQRTTIMVRRGATATISGWLGTADGNALGSQTVRILTAPDNGSQQFDQVASATTASDGTWSAQLPAGPSRLVVAQYDGSSTVEPAASAPARVVVPASVSLRIRPGHTHWGGRIRISGRVQGGYVPPSGELVVLWIGWRGGSTEIGHLYTRSDGRFRSKYTFLRGNGTETYRLWAATARESDYPYAPGRSRSVVVMVRP